MAMNECFTINDYNETPTFHETASINIFNLKAFQSFLKKYNEVKEVLYYMLGSKGGIQIQ